MMMMMMMVMMMLEPNTGRQWTQLPSRPVESDSVTDHCRPCPEFKRMLSSTAHVKVLP
jgi:hypothetical protein